MAAEEVAAAVEAGAVLGNQELLREVTRLL